MIMLSKSDLAVLLIDSEICRPRWLHSEDYQRTRENAIQPILHRSSIGHDDHGRKVTARSFGDWLGDVEGRSDG